MQRTMIINADDFGLCVGVNRAIYDAHVKGVLTSTTLMAAMPGAAEAVAMAKELPRLGVGVHLNLVEGYAVNTSPETACILTDDKQFKFKPGKLAMWSMLCPCVRRAIDVELRAQIQWVFDAGIKPTHFDSHKHVHAFPTIFPIVCKLAREFNVPIIRNVYEPAEVCGANWPPVDAEGKKRAKMLRAMAMLDRYIDSKVFVNNMLLGVAHTGTIDAQFFKAAAASSCGPVAEVMTHPGYPEGLDAGKTRLVAQRKKELDALLSEETKQYLQTAGIKLVHYGQINK